MDLGEFDKEWVKAFVAREVNNAVSASKEEIQVLTHKLEVTKQTLTVCIANLLTLRKTVQEAGAFYEHSGAAMAFDVLSTALTLEEEEYTALASYIQRYNKLDKDTPVDTTPVATAGARGSAASDMDAANARMSRAYARALSVEARTQEMQERVRRRIESRNAASSDMDNLLMQAVDNQDER